MGKELSKSGEQIIEASLTTLKRTVESVREYLTEHAERMPEGVRYEVAVQPMPILTGPTGEAKPNDIASYDAFQMNPRVYTRQRLGILTVTGVGTPTLTFDYHSVSKGPDFKITMGETETKVKGLPAETAYSALTSLLKTLPGQGIDNQQGIYLTSQFNVAFTDRSGYLLTPKRRLVQNFLRRISPFKKQ